MIPRSKDNNVIDTKWVFKVKYNEDGSVERYKARVVANGIRQIQGSDYEETFSLIIHPLSIRLILSMEVTYNWSIRKIDISNAFLLGKLDERIIVSRPYGFQDPEKPDYVYLLNKALYGLKQSPHC